jgi:hypothetical protein
VSKTVTNLTLKQMPLLVKLLELPINTKSTPGVYTQTGGKLTVRAAIPGETTGRLAAETSTVTPSVTLEVTGTELTLTTVKAEGSEKLTLTKNPDSESLIPSN